MGSFGVLKYSGFRQMQERGSVDSLEGVPCTRGKSRDSRLKEDPVIKEE